MLHSNSETEAAKTPGDPQPPEKLQTDVNGESAVQVRAIRYMDDDTFRRSLEEVITVHDRLLAKLAE